MEYPDTRLVRWIDDDTGEECGSCEYIRKDKYDDLKKAADELVRAVGDLHESTGLSTYCLTSSLTAYRKATGAT